MFKPLAIMAMMRREIWRSRLIAAIKKSGRSYRDISLNAGLGPSFVHQLVTTDRVPNIEALIGICAELGISVTYVLTGTEIEASEEEMLLRFSSLNAEQKRVFLAFLRTLDAKPGANE